MSDEIHESSPITEEEKEEKVESEEEEEQMKDTEDADTSKEEEKNTPKKDKKEVKKEGKDKKKGQKDKEEEEGSDEEEEEEEEEESSPKVGTLEMPVVLEKGAKRERKKVERLAFQSPSGEEKKKFEVSEGKGSSLGDIPFIDFKISRTKAEDLKPLHRVLFRKPGSNNDCKKNIRKFSGFPFSKSDEEYKKRLEMMTQLKFTLAMVKNICEVLDIQKKGTKEEIVTRLLEFLMKPSDGGRKLPKPKRKRESKGKGEKKVKKQKREKKEKKSKAKTDSDEEEEEDEEDEEQEEEEEEEKEEEEKEEPEEEDDEDEDFAKPPKKKAKRTPKKKEEKKETKKKEVKEKPKKKETKPQKKATPKKKKEEMSDISDISDSDGDSDDEPLVKKTGPPTNDELKDLIKKMLDSANLEEVTMKTVLKDVYAKYPNHDLSDRKEFIKNTVKQIIS